MARRRTNRCTRAGPADLSSTTCVYRSCVRPSELNRWAHNAMTLMNRTRWIILLTGVVLFGLSELFPPWVYEDENTSVRRSAGYHLFNRPPKLKSPPEMRAIFSLRPSEPTKFMWVHLNGGRLLAQRLFLVAATPGLIFALANRRSLIKILLAILFLIPAICFLGLFAFDVWAMR
jgi:hypothetical protein